MRGELLEAARLLRQVRAKLYTAASQAEDVSVELPEMNATALELAGNLRELAYLSDYIRGRVAREAKYTAAYLDVEHSAARKAERDG